MYYAIKRISQWKSLYKWSSSKLWWCIRIYLKTGDAVAGIPIAQIPHVLLVHSSDPGWILEEGTDQTFALLSCVRGHRMLTDCGAVGVHRLAGLCPPWLGAVPPHPNIRSGAGQWLRTRDSCGLVITRWGCGDKTIPGVFWAIGLWIRGPSQWPDKGMVITQLQHSSGRGQGWQP